MYLKVFDREKLKEDLDGLDAVLSKNDRARHVRRLYIIGIMF